MSYEQQYGRNYRYDYDDDEEQTNWTYVVTGALFVAAGAYLIYRGVNQEEESHDRYAQTRSRGSGIQVRESVVVNKPVEELYNYWRDFENLPRIMSHLEEVTTMGNRSHWKAKGPLNTRVEWDATTVEDRPNELVSWRSLENAQVPNEGSVRFSSQGASSTEVLVSLIYHPPGGPVGAAVAKLFGEEPSQQIRDDLQNFKQAMESGTLTSGTSGSSYGDSSLGGSSLGASNIGGSSVAGTNTGSTSLGSAGTGSTLGGSSFGATGTGSTGGDSLSSSDTLDTEVEGSLTDSSLAAEEEKDSDKF